MDVLGLRSRGRQGASGGWRGLAPEVLPRKKQAADPTTLPAILEQADINGAAKLASPRGFEPLLAA